MTTTGIQQTIGSYMAGKTLPSVFDLQCFVGMIETGEATWEDFREVGGDVLVADVAKAMQRKDDEE